MRQLVAATLTLSVLMLTACSSSPASDLEKDGCDLVPGLIAETLSNNYEQTYTSSITDKGTMCDLVREDGAVEFAERVGYSLQPLSAEQKASAKDGFELVKERGDLEVLETNDGKAFATWRGEQEDTVGLMTAYVGDVEVRVSMEREKGLELKDSDRMFKLAQAIGESYSELQKA